MCECDHDMWDHELIDEDDDNLYFGKCEVKDCKCEQYRQKEKSDHFLRTIRNARNSYR